MTIEKLAIELPTDLADQLSKESAATETDVSTVIKQALEEYLLEQQQGREFALEDDCND